MDEDRNKRQIVINDTIFMSFTAWSESESLLETNMVSAGYTFWF